MSMESRAIAANIQRDLYRLPGIATPAVRALRRRYSKMLAHESPKTVLGIADQLMPNGPWAERVIASELVIERTDVVGLLNATVIERWMRGLSDWGSVDAFGVTVPGVAWREGRISDAAVLKWARSTDRWRRRLALVATVPLNVPARGGSGDAARTLLVCRALIDDRDDMVVKAMSWALRALAKRDRASVKGFLRDSDIRLAARVRREVGRQVNA